MWSGRALAASALALAGASAAIACGPFFPWQLFDQRENALNAAPDNGFAYEAARLVAPSDALRPVELANRGWNSEEDNAAATMKQRTDDEAIGLSPEQVEMVGQMRATDDGDAAFALGTGLPEDVRLYTAGADDFAHERRPEATARFKAVLALPDEKNRLRATWAAYSLGRMIAEDDSDGAIAQFQAVRRLAKAGASDPLGLAVASWGEEAKVHLDRAQAATAEEGRGWSPATAAAYRQEMTTAVALYAQQAAHKSDVGLQSLRIVAGDILSKPAWVAAVIDDDLTRRLLIGVVAAGDDRRLGSLISAIERSTVEAVDGADRLAAAAYKSGRYDFARRLVDRAPSPLASWVKAKLALQEGEIDAAAGFYAEAVKNFPTSDGLSPSNAQRLLGERAVLTLARGEYVGALEQLYAVGATYWGDLAYVAERVLTVDELKEFVDHRAPAIKPALETQPPLDEGTWGIDPAVALRNLLARRLVRVGRYREAIGYFISPLTKDDGKPLPEVRKAVEDYAAALKRAADAWWKIDRAEAWYRAAVLARQSGMEMMGYEGVPDQYNNNGELDDGIGFDKLDGPLITDGEKQRFAMTAGQPEWRFHYRFIAADAATKAADLLPPRSQAFAAVLCRATGWMSDSHGDPDRLRAMYGRYLKEGARVPWASHFGRNCPEPDFDGARRLRWVEPIWAARHFVGRYRWVLGALLLFVVAGTATVTLRRRQRPV